MNHQTNPSLVVKRVHKFWQVGELVAKARHAKNWDREQLAIKIRISPEVLADFEQGVADIPLQTALEVLAATGLVVSIQPHSPPTQTDILQAIAKEEWAPEPNDPLSCKASSG
jgi:transcriptional regulator with XRE-family HTH domain